MDWLGRLIGFKGPREDEDPRQHKVRQPQPVIPSIEHKEYLDLLIQARPSLKQHQDTLHSARDKFLELRNFSVQGVNEGDPLVDVTPDLLGQPHQFSLLWPTATSLYGNQEVRFFPANQVDRSHFTFLGRTFVNDIVRSQETRIFFLGLRCGEEPHSRRRRRPWEVD